MKQTITILLTVMLCTGSINMYAQAPMLHWAHAFGSETFVHNLAMTLDAGGNVYTTGYFEGTVDFDPGPGVFNLTSDSTDTFHIFIQKSSALGNLIWVKQIVLPGYKDGRSITVDNFNNVYVTGSFFGTADFDPGAGVFNLTSAGKDDIFVLKLNSSGNFLWAKRIGSPGDDGGNCIKADALGNVYVTGYFQETADFNPGAGVFNMVAAGPGGDDIFVLKLDANGNFRWAKRMGEGNADIGNSLAVDATGNVYTTGFYVLWGLFLSPVDFDPGAGAFLLGGAGQEIFIQKLDSAGNFVWAKGIGSTGNNVGLSIALDASGNVYTTGFFQLTVDFDPGPGVANLTCAGSKDAFILKLDNAGNYVWAKQMGSTAFDAGRAIAVDNAGNVYTTGQFSGTVDFDPNAGVTNLTSTVGVSDIFIQSLNSAGNFLWAKSMGGPLFQNGVAIAVSSPGTVYVSGDFSMTVDFNPDAPVFNITSPGFESMFVLKLGPTGALPIKLLSFSASQNENEIKTEWTTATETNNDYFTLERSSDAVNFEPISTVKGAGNSTSEREYAFADEHPFKGVSYYRLKQTDYDGHFSYSDAVAVSIVATHDFMVYPNPTTGRVFLNINSHTSENLRADVTDVTGRMVLSEPIQTNDGATVHALDLSSFEKGTYLVQLKGENFYEVKKIVVE